MADIHNKQPPIGYTNQIYHQRLKVTKSSSKQSPIGYCCQIHEHLRIMNSPRFLVTIFLLFLFIDFSRAQNLRYSILEEQDPDLDGFVGNVKENADLDPAHMDEYVFSFRYDDDNYRLFTINPRTGIIRTKSKLDRESICLQNQGISDCEVALDVTVRPVDYFKIVKIVVVILDVNDHVPEFGTDKVVRSVSEDILTGITLSLPQAVDADSGVNAIQNYKIQPLQDGGMNADKKFGLQVTPNSDGSKDISLVVLERLDREEESSYAYKITASDGGDPVLSASMVVQITVTDSNDNSPVFNRPIYNVEIFENIDEGTSIIKVEASDPDSGDNGRVLYSFSAHTQALYGHLFTINNSIGDITVTGEINYESDSVYHLTVTASDHGPNSRPAFCKVVVTVIDQNDHPPEISLNTFTDSGFAEVLENSDAGTFVCHVSVSDPDEGDSGRVRCEIDTANRPYFDLQQISDTTFEFKVITRVTFDREIEHTHRLTITCTDSGTPRPLSRSQEVNVHILDRNDHDPEFSDRQYYANLQENNTVNSFVTKIIAGDKDIDENSRLTYSIKAIHSGDENLIKINPDSGIIKTNTVFDYEKRHNYEYKVMARDHGNPPRMAETLFNLTVIDINDESPVFNQSAYSFTIKENKPIGTTVGFVTSTDRDSYPFNSISYFIDASDRGLGHEYFAIRNTGEIVTTVALDREEIVEYELVVIAHNEGYANTISTTRVTVHVMDRNDNGPVIHYPNPINRSIDTSTQTPVGHIIAIVNATDPDIGRNGALFFTLETGNEDGFFVIDNTTGVISVAKSLDIIEHEMFTITILVHDLSPEYESPMGVTQPVEYNAHESRANLQILVDSAILFTVSEQTNQLTNMDSIMLPLGIIVGVIILLMLVILAILVIKYRYRRQVKASHKYNCRLEANKTLICNGPQVVHPGNGSAKPGGYPDREEGKDGRSSSQDGLMEGTEAEKHYRKETISREMMMDFHRNSCPLKAHGTQPYLETELSRNHTKMPDIVNLSHLEVDSECSGADSGKGTSEEGDYSSQSNHSSPNNDQTDPEIDTHSYSQQPPQYTTATSISKQLYNIQSRPSCGSPGSDCDLYSDPGVQGHGHYYPSSGMGGTHPLYHRNNYSPLVTFSHNGKTNSLDVVPPLYSSSQSKEGNKVERSYSYGTGSIDNVRSKLSNVNNVRSYPRGRKPVRGAGGNEGLVGGNGGYQPVDSSHSPTHHEESLIAYPEDPPLPPPPAPSNTSPRGYNNNNNNTKHSASPLHTPSPVTNGYESSNHAYETSPNAPDAACWSGREGSIRGRSDGRRHLFGSEAMPGDDNNEQYVDDDYNSLTASKKSAFRAIGGNQRNTLQKKKEVRFADKCLELKTPWDVAGISGNGEDEMGGGGSSVDGLSEDGTSLTSGSYVLEGSTPGEGGCQDTFV